MHKIPLCAALLAALASATLAQAPVARDSARVRVLEARFDRRSELVSAELAGIGPAHLSRRSVEIEVRDAHGALVSEQQQRVRLRPRTVARARRGWSGSLRAQVHVPAGGALVLRTDGAHP